MTSARWLGGCLAVLAGLAVGVGTYTFYFAKGFSYFSRDPKACANCHIMRPQFDAWKKASHHHAAVCADCHLPHGLLPKYLAKADNGFRHSKGFTFQNFHEPILITRRNSGILNDNCLRCHADLMHGIGPADAATRQPVKCVHCHPRVGHGETTGLGRFDPKEGD